MCEKVEKVEYKEKKSLNLKKFLKYRTFWKMGGVLKENYIPKNGLYIGLHKITCNFF